MKARLAEAEAALHTLSIGQTPNEIRDQNGELVKYNPANAGRLRAYIYELKVRLGMIRPGPMTAWVGP
jgi:hypothetical protein